MQSKRAMVMLAVSILAGVAAVVLAARWMGQQAAGERATVLVATSDLELGQAIRGGLRKRKIKHAKAERLCR